MKRTMRLSFCCLRMGIFLQNIVMTAPLKKKKKKREIGKGRPRVEIVYIYFHLKKKSFFCLFRATPVAYGGSQARGSNWSYSCWPTPQPQQRHIWATSVTYTIAHSNAGFQTYWVRPGIKPVSSWMLVRFVSTKPWQELPQVNFINTPRTYYFLRVSTCWQEQKGSFFYVPQLPDGTEANTFHTWAPSHQV